MPKKEVKIGRGMKELIKDFTAASPEDWWLTAKDGISNVFKGAKDLVYQKYCPHLDKLITIKTDPPTCECEECVKEMINGFETDNSDR